MEAWLCPPRLMVSTCRIICLSACKKSTSPLPSFLRYSKDIRNFYFGYFEQVWLWPIKNDTTSVEKTLTFIFMQKITSFLKCCKDDANLLSWVLWAHLAKPTKSNIVILYETQMFICKQKINLITQIFYWYYTLENPAM